ncbi:hypothetical protein ACUHMQ_17370 [Chitinimonas sp. PSY-7]|uniref:hypothetical protein n=1 Tax=Chitinimonas sp. PSY-7 TaxID=3459088 RepID=UPI00404029C3
MIFAENKERIVASIAHQFAGGHRCWQWLTAAAVSLLVVACGGPGGQTTTTPPPTTDKVPAKLVVTASTRTIKTDGSDSATITVTALDSGNRVIAGIPIDVSAPLGSINIVDAVTKTDGTVSGTFKAGADRSNRTETIIATASGISGQIPIVVSGTKIKLVPTTTSVSAPNGTSTVTVSLVDSADQSISDQDVALSFSGTGAIQLSKTVVRSGDTVTVTGATTGAVKLQASALNATQTVDFTITGGNAFGFVTPASSPLALVTGTSTNIVVNAPGVANVRLTTTLGAFGNSVPPVSTIVVPVSGGQATTTFSSSSAGTATISALDPATPATTANTVFAITPPVSAAAKIIVQASPSTIGISSGTDFKSLTVTATVLNSSGQPIANVPVAFTIKNPVGGGESLAPAIAYTVATAGQGLGIGQANTTFTSGSVVSPVGANGINVVATVVGTNPAITAEAPVLIGGQAGSITIGSSSEIKSSSDNTSYILPMSVQVTDSGGNPVSNADVTITVAPYAFSTGRGCRIGKTYVAEDLIGNWNIDTGLNIPQTAIGNGLLDTGEDGARVEINNDSLSRGAGVLCYDGTVRDANGNSPAYTCPNPPTVAVAPNSILEPPKATAGAVPSKVVTGANGIAGFNFDYLKANALWTVVKVVATTKVSTTEASTAVIFRLGASVADYSPPSTCFITDSPYKQ